MILPGHGRHLRDHPHLRHAHDLRLQGHRLLVASPSPAWAPSSGRHHMFTSGMSDVAQHRLLAPHLPRGRARAPSRSSTGWPRSTRARSSSTPPLLYRPHLHLPVLHRRADGPHAGRAGHQRAHPRHLLHRGALPLRDVRRHGLRPSSRPCSTGSPRCSAGCTTKPGRHRRLGRPSSSGFNMLYFAHARPRAAGHAAALLRPTCPSSTRVTCIAIDRLLASGRGASAHLLRHSASSRSSGARRRRSNPWGGVTLEWQVPSPPPTENFETIPDGHATGPTSSTGPHERRTTRTPRSPRHRGGLLRAGARIGHVALPLHGDPPLRRPLPRSTRPTRLRYPAEFHAAAPWSST